MKSESAVDEELMLAGLEFTGQKTLTGNLWRHRVTGKPATVPFSENGFYSDSLYARVRRIIDAAQDESDNFF